MKRTAFATGDPAGLHHFNGIFGGNLTVNRKPEFAASFTYQLDADRDLIIDTIGTGLSYQSESLLVLESGVTQDSQISIRTKRSLRYTAGSDAELMFTGLFSQSPFGSFQKIGLFNGENGFAIGQKDGVPHIFRLYNSNWIDEVPQSEWNSDKLDGTGLSKFNLNPQKLNIFRIVYGYLGIAPIYYQIFGGSEIGWITFHVIDLTNRQELTHIKSPYLPLQSLVSNGSNSTNVYVKSGSVYAGTFGTDSGHRDGSLRTFTVKLDAISVPSGVNNQIAVFHNKELYNGAINHIESKLHLLSIATDGNKTVTIDAYKLKEVPTGGIWSDVDPASVMTTSTDTVIDLLNAELLLSINLAKIDKFFEILEELKILLLPNEYAAFVVTSAGDTDINISISYDDLF